MNYFNYGHSHNSDFNKNRIIVNTLSKVIEKGFDMSRNHFDDQLYRLWVDFSKEMVQLATRDTQYRLYVDYLELLIDLNRLNLSPEQKLNSCLKFLIEVSKSFA